MRKIITIVVLLCLAVALASCGAKEAPTPPVESASPSPAAESPSPAAPSVAPSAEPESPAPVESTEPEPEEPFTLNGEWKQTNINDPSSYHIATITDDAIEILWASDDDDVKMLYWAGTFESPAKDETATITSQADHEQTDSALLASMDDTKDFEYKSGVLSYEFSAMGVTMTVEMERIG